jgi:hypothetical protein
MCKRNALHTKGECECQQVDPPHEGDKLEYSMIVYRACLGDPHIAVTYDKEKYRGTPDRPVRRPPDKPAARLGVASMEQHDCVVGESKENGGNRLRYREVIFYDRGLAYPEYLVSFTRVAPPGMQDWHRLTNRVYDLVKSAFDLFFESLPAGTKPTYRGTLTTITKPLRSPLVRTVLENGYTLCKDCLMSLPPLLEGGPTARQTESLKAALMGLEELNDFWARQEKMKASGLAEEFLRKHAQEPEPEPEPGA